MNRAAGNPEQKRMKDAGMAMQMKQIHDRSEGRGYVRIHEPEQARADEQEDQAFGQLE